MEQSFRPLFGDFLFFIRKLQKEGAGGGSLPLSIILLVPKISWICIQLATLYLHNDT